MNKIGNYIKDSYRELAERVTWPSWNELQQSTMIVLAATVIITLIVGLMDVLAGGGLNFLYKLLYS
ncbi:MAG TPA: preprotein translocase subunit SecE [Niabella sp.]|nr:preprotein translocase subunit SecE [Niabella sp.]HOZ97083.1 preprotein translocase subunit SecE [Niabella sp.]HQW15283.1 preprotein translocase subunit SecE [Niabella sp.]HQX20467.1 preprotein translocase subunit SecE [Niabella sp.]HQX42676.1 preprotein translocase subunit SecE [Niabella sp.]